MGLVNIKKIKILISLKLEWHFKLYKDKNINYFCFWEGGEQFMPEIYAFYFSINANKKQILTEIMAYIHT